MSVDLLVIGGGLVGYACAWRASKRGLRVVLVDDARDGRASRASAGMLAPSSELDSIDARVLEAGARSLEKTPAFFEALERDAQQQVARTENGTLWVALDRDHEHELERLVALHRSAGLDGAWLDADATRALEPSLSPRVVAGYHLPHEFSVDPGILQRALGRAFARNGGTRVVASATELLRDGERVVGARIANVDAGRDAHASVGGPRDATTSAHGAELRADRTLVAAGAWSSTLLERDVDFRVRPVKGQTLVLGGARVLSRVLRTPDVYLVPRGDKVVLGASSEEVGFDASPRAGVVRELLDEGIRTLPELREHAVDEINVGFRPALRDALPALGPTKTPGLLCATGHYRHGVLLLALTAHLIESALFEGASAIPPGFRAERFSEAT